MSSADDSAVSAADVRLLFAHLVDYPALILAVSGGPDSTALMLLAARWRKARKRGPKLVAVTVDHGLRPEAKREAAAVKKLARSLGIEHRTLRWAGRKPKTGIQEAARAARYCLLADVSRKTRGAPVLTAHTRDDQAETVLFRMMRGSGIGGLAGMRRGNRLPGHEAEKIELIRPLLDIPKSRLIATLKAAKVPYAVDPTNRDPRFTRPRLRELMPRLAAEGLTAERLARLALRARRAEAALQEAVQAALPRLAPVPWPEAGPVVMDAAEFCGLAEEIGLRVLERAIDGAGDEGPVELGKLEALFGALTDAMEGAHAAPHGAARFRRTLAGAVVTLMGGRLVVERAPPRRSGRARAASKRP
ncbi:MAG: tRNA lysidine(34) synthetase TilS [Xanthobacteraceae bacterium]|nr:tRNA lysidine(34) synthetase TilS [Xanthobacteraceae bacterium]